MAEKNGNGLMGRVVLWLAGIIVTLICFIAIPTMANNIIQNDRESRIEDAKLWREIGGVQTALAEQTIALKYIKSSMEEEKVRSRTVDEKILLKLDSLG